MTFMRCLAWLTLCALCACPIQAETPPKKGPIADKIYFNVKMKPEIGLKDAAEGLTDIFFFGVDGPAIFGLDQATRDKLDLYVVPGGSWSLLFNPIPNRAPYLVKVGEQEQFNPFAIREARFALNYLINRKYIVDEILSGAGGAMFTMATPGQPGAQKYTMLAQRMGLTEEGDEQNALRDIAAALESAAALPELQGRLAKRDAWWTFDGALVTVKFLIRVDDPQGRLKEGEYVAQQIEKAGIKVERLLWDRAKCSQTVYGGNPANYEWTMYTEGWGAGATRAYWEHIVAQMYAPWYGYMPGGANPENWRYAHQELDDVTRRAFSGNFLTEDDYWTLALRGAELGINEAVRVYVAYQNQYYAANKARFTRRMLYGLADGLNEWSLLSAETPDGILNITGYSAKGSLFMHAWDPVGDDGFSDVYSQVCATPTGMAAMFESPATAADMPLLVTPRDVMTQARQADDGKLLGELPVPGEAIRYDSAADAWVRVAAGTTAISSATYAFQSGKFHHGRPIAVADFLYVNAFEEEWSRKDGEQDRFYDASFESSHQPGRDTLKGWVIHPDQTITTYFDYNFPASKQRVASKGAPTLSVLSGRPNITVAWEILEAVSRLVAEGSASGTAYSFTNGAATSVDLLRPSCVADIRAKLAELREKRLVPASLNAYVTPEQAAANYAAAIAWIDAHGHALIGCGAFYIEKYDPATNYMELTAFRDPAYPFTPDYWPNALKTTSARIDSADIPAMFALEEKIMSVRVQLMEVDYPSDAAKPAEHGAVTVTLVTETQEMSYPAEYVEPGVFEARIPVETLAAGTYAILVNAELAGALPAAASGVVVLY